jgi:hypothetical protein
VKIIEDPTARCFDEPRLYPMKARTNYDLSRDTDGKDLAEPL